VSPPPDAPKPPAVPKVAAPKAPKLEAPKAPKAPKAPAAPKATGPAKPGGRTTKSGGRRMPAAPQSPLMKVLAPVMALVLLVGLVFFIVERLRTRANAPRGVSVFHLQVGECVIPPTQVTAEIATVNVVACHVPHTQQVFALVSDDVPGGNYPGASALKTFADGACLQHFQGFVGVDYRDSSLFYTYMLPSVRSWASGDRTVTCLITTTGQQLTTSVQRSNL